MKCTRGQKICRCRRCERERLARGLEMAIRKKSSRLWDKRIENGVRW